MNQYPHYETVAAGQTDQVLGGSGSKGGDTLGYLILIPASTSPGAVAIDDNGGTDITVFAGGASSLTELKPIVVEMHVKSKAGPWRVTTGANISVLAVGEFH